jgi:voltage-gated potassium channel Kch
MKRIKHVTEKDNFAYLTVALALLLFGIELADQLGFELGQLLLQAVIVVTLALGVWSIKSPPRWFMTRLGLLIATVLVTLAGLFLNVHHMAFLWLSTLLAYLLATTWLAMRQVLLSGPIDRNKIVGAICIFLLLGLIWATLYVMLAHFVPDAYKGLAPAPWYEIFPELVYFSFVTLTTLGYGDISPAAPLGRFLVLAEAVVGQFYIAILVASLVGMRLSVRQE